jgi:hypothetical protein
MKMNSIDELLKSLLGDTPEDSKQDLDFLMKSAEKPEPEKVVPEKVVPEKVADDKTTDPSEEKMTREELMKLDNLELMPLLQATMGGEPEQKTAETGTMSLEEAVTILDSVSAADLEDALTDLEKEAEEEVDLTKISALDYLQALGEMQEEESEKTASVAPDGYEEIDLSQITGAELMAGLESGDIVIPDLQKEAELEEGEIDLSTISGAELIAGLEDGSIVLEGMEKEAEDQGTELTPEETSYAMGLIISDGIMDGLIAKNDEIEKQAEVESEAKDSVKQALIELLQEMDSKKKDLSKEAGSEEAVGMNNQPRSMSALQHYLATKAGNRKYEVKGGKMTSDAEQVDGGVQQVRKPSSLAERLSTIDTASKC